MNRVVIALVSLGVSIGTAWANEDDVYIFDALARSNYRAAYAQLIKKATVPDWVRNVLRTGDGVATPAKTVSIGGKPFRLDRVCKLNDCTGNSLTVLFSPNGIRAWAALTDKGGAPILLGDPKPEIAQALTGATKP